MTTDMLPQPGLPSAASAASTARGRPSWSGLLRLSLVSVPIKAYPIVNTASASPFHQLHAACGQRIRYEKRCPLHGPVDASAIVRGYAYGPDHHVVVEPEELDQLRPIKDKALLLEHFLPAHHVDPAFFAGRSLYLLPDGLATQHPYNVVAEAMRQAGTWALGRVVFASQRSLVLVRPTGRCLVLDVLHYPAQLRTAPNWAAQLPTGLATPAELRLAQQLIDAASGPLDWSCYRDSSAEELAALVETKIAQRTPSSAAADEPTAVVQLLDALKQSVAATLAAQNGNPAAPTPSRQSPTARRQQS